MRDASSFGQPSDAACIHYLSPGPPGFGRALMIWHEPASDDEVGDLEILGSIWHDPGSKPRYLCYDESCPGYTDPHKRAESSPE